MQSTSKRKEKFTQFSNPTKNALAQAISSYHICQRFSVKNWKCKEKCNDYPPGTLKATRRTRLWHSGNTSVPTRARSWFHIPDPPGRAGCANACEPCCLRVRVDHSVTTLFWVLPSLSSPSSSLKEEINKYIFQNFFKKQLREVLE